MNISYKRTQHVSHMIVETEDMIPEFVSMMIKENSIPGVLGGSESVSNGKTRYWIDISGKKSLRAYFSQEGITAKTIADCLNGISSVADYAAGYLINQEFLLTGLDVIFTESKGESTEFFLACTPKCVNGFDAGFKSIFEYLIQNVNHENEEITKICYELYEMSEKSENSLSDYIRYISEFDTCIEEAEEYKTDYQKHEPEAAYEADMYDDIWDEKPKKKKKESFRTIVSKVLEKKDIKLPQIKALRKGEEDFLDFDDFILDPLPYDADKEEMTAKLKTEDMWGRRLCYIGHGSHKDIPIEKAIVRIGSRGKDNDAIIPEETISRCHAVISRDGEEYYIEDLESKNGTFVNGKILDIKGRKKLSSGDKISFANVGYIFE